MISDKAKKEVEKLKLQYDETLKTVETLRNQTSTSDTVFKTLKKERHKYEDKSYKLRERMDEIESRGISTSEKTSLTKEAFSGFTTIKRDRSLGITSFITIGFSKVLDSYVKCDLSRYSSLFNNVRGCSSLANTKRLNSFSIITKEEYDKIIEKNELEINNHGQRSVIPIRTNV